MSRRVDEVSGRCEVGTSLAGLSQAPGGLPAGVGLTTAGFVRGPAVTGVQAVPRQSVAAVATATIPSAVAAVPVATTTSTLQAGPATPDHQPNPSSQPGYTCAKVDKHSGIHHTVPAYSSNMPTAPPPQGGLTSVVEGRTVGGPGGPQGGGGLVGQGGAAIPPVLQHVSAHSQVRHKMGELTSHELFQQVSGVGGATGVVHQTSAAAAAAAAAAGAVGAAAGAQQGSGQFQRLKVEDALSYLDQVKLRFGKQPQVYNDFLDIMKEFKSQSIDTPGVISRVSILFQGHPELIVGFNTFLPPGYKIEVSMSVPGQQTMVVHTPQGVQQHVTSTHQPQLPPAVTVKPPQRLQPPRSNLSAAGTVAVQHNPGTVGAHTVHTVGPGATPPRLPTPGPPAAPGAVVGGTNQTAQSAANTQHSTNTAPQHQQREPPPPAPQLPPPPPPPQQQQPPAQPVEFNHAINYVNKIKLRFQGQPDIYKQFLDILHTYQKEQRYIKEGVSAGRTLTETEVYEKVAKLFENQEDLLQEFGQFLPDATNNTATQEAVSDFMDQYKTNLGSNKGVANDHTAVKKSAVKGSNLSSSNNLPGSGSSGNKTSPIFGHQLKRPHTTHSGSTPTHSHSHTTQPPTKKPKLNYLKDMSAAEAGKYATLSEYAFFDKVRKALRHEETYHNFLRCITLYNEEIISRLELVQLVHPFLSKFPDLLKWFKDFVGYRDGVVGSTDIIPASVAKQERISGELAMEIDYNTCKRLGASYCALPKSYPQPKCSGRTQLCREVLNDTWVSFPSWSEDSTFVTSRKTQYEEYIYRCEDERFELDVVLETNLATIRVLEGVQKKLQRMGPEEAARFRLDDSLGGNSPTIHQRAIRRIYGDKAPDIIDGLKKNPVVAVPLVLRRLKAKDEEWREAQKGFNKIWREQNEKYYLKSLDHQGITFKQNDVKTIRSKSLLNDIETLFDERHEQAEESGEVITGPHMCLQYKDKSVLDDAANLVIHHVKRQTTIHKDDKCKIKQTMRQFIPDLFFHPKHEMSDDEKDIEEEEEDDEDNQSESKGDGTSNKRELRERECKQQSYVSTPSNKRKGRLRGSDNEKENENGKKDKTKEGEGNGNGRGKVTMNGDATEEEKVSIKQEVDEKPDIKDVFTEESDDEYRLFMGNNNWYLFLRLHQILCSRLTTMYNHAVRIAAQEAKDRKDRKESTAVALRLKPKNEIAVEDYYPALLDMVKNVLDGNMESTVYEDTLREMFGIHAFTAFTLDKVVNGAVRQLQHLVCDEPCQQCTQLYLQESRKGGSGGPLASAHRRLAMEQAYQKKAEQVLQDENCFKIYTYQRDCRMTIELVDTEVEGDDDNGGGGGNSAPSSNIPSNVAEVERWSEYVERYVSCVSPEMSPAMMSQLSRKPVFLPRNLRSWRKLTAARQRLTQQGQGDREKSSNGDGEDSKTSLVSDMEMLDNTQCKFNLASFKMVFVVNSDSYMYKKKALQRAKQSHECVSERMRRGMREWQELWCSRHVSDANHRATTEWLMGRAESLLPNRTKMVRIDNPSRAPYAPYNKYKCEMLDEGS